MAVLFCSTCIFAVIYVEDRDLVLAEDLVKLFCDAVKVMDNIIPAVVSMACVKADAKLVIMDNAIIDACQLFEGTTDL